MSLNVGNAEKNNDDAMFTLKDKMFLLERANKSISLFDFTFLNDFKNRD